MDTMKFDLNVFSYRLRTLRSMRGDSRAKISEKTGIPLYSIGSYERGDKVPGADTLKLLCEYYQVSADYLLGLSDSPKAASEWPPAVPIGAVKSVDIIKNSVESMLSTVGLSPYGLRLFDYYAKIFESLLEINSFAAEKLHELQLDYPDFRDFGTEMEMSFDNTPILLALAAGYEEAKDFAQKLNAVETEIEDKALEIADKIRLILVDDVVSSIKGKSSSKSQDNKIKNPSDD